MAENSDLIRIGVMFGRISRPASSFTNAVQHLNRSANAGANQNGERFSSLPILKKQEQPERLY